MALDINLIKDILKKNNVTKASLFGSYARGDEKFDSDVDILIDLPVNASLLDLSRIKINLEDAIHKKVDLVTFGSLKPKIKPYVLKDMKVII